MSFLSFFVPRSHRRGPGTAGWRSLAAALFTLAFLASPAQALDFGTLRLYLPPGQAPYAEIALSDSAGLDPADVRARIATPDAYGVAGMRYLPALAAITITPQAAANGQVVLRLDRLPAPGDAPEIDLLLLVGDRMSLALGEYRVDLQGSRREFAAQPAGSRLASNQGGSGGPAAARATTAPVVSNPSTSVPIAPVERPAAAPAPGPGGPASAGDASAVTAEVQAALDAWAAAWSSRDVDAYLAAYLPDFAGRAKGTTREAWAEQRRSRILARKRISVELSQVQIVPRGDTVVATFTQRYRGDELVERSRKRMVFVKAGDRWLIQDEGEL
jgi:ketosteroid isomerase-like protein